MMTIEDSRVLRMLDEWDAQHGPTQQAVIARLKLAPCAGCGSSEDVDVICCGSLGKLTPMCRFCRERAA